MQAGGRAAAAVAVGTGGQRRAGGRMDRQRDGRPAANYPPFRNVRPRAPIKTEVGLELAFYAQPELFPAIPLKP